MVDGFYYFILGGELSLLLLSIFTIFLPLKEKENKLTKNDKLTRIKKYILINTLKEIKTTISINGISFGISFVLILLMFLGINLLIFQMTIILFMCLYILTTVFLFVAYFSHYMKRKDICDAKNIKEILKIMKVKKENLQKIEGVINCSLDGKDNNLTAWILDNIEIDKRVVK